ncbi:hypothetical protein BMF94_4642 [Rhodotorula taiwanensis]|uniref:Uncharacterized protein n=1 Tax=Rhodotorula taiwanensis TaxID=741276 RepID=A0A2S5B6D3_9BASI|nr:hypothetical protein BMF94_4642 [Rhodotorula taiwanensis]
MAEAAKTAGPRLRPARPARPLPLHPPSTMDATEGPHVIAPSGAWPGESHVGSDAAQVAAGGHDSFDPLRAYVRELVPESPSSQSHEGFTPFFFSLYSSLPTAPDSPRLSTPDADGASARANGGGTTSTPSHSVERHAGPSRSTSGDRPRNFSRPLALQPRPFSPHVRFAVESVALSTAELDVPPTEGASIDAGPAEAASPPAAELGDARECATE